MDTDASNDSIDHGHADQFLTEEELLDFRGSTYLLSITNAVGGGQAKQFAPERPPVNAKDRLYRKLASACDLHVRHNEVIALTCPNLDGRLKDIFTIYVNEYDTAQEEDLEDENVPQSVFVAANQRDDDRGHRRLFGRIHNENYSGGQKKGKFPKTSQSLAQHSANIIKFIKQTWDSENSEARRMAQLKASDYVYLSSVAKVLGRVERGGLQKGRGSRKGRNFHNFLTFPSKRITAEHPEAANLNPRSKYTFTDDQVDHIELCLTKLGQRSAQSILPLQDWKDKLTKNEALVYDASARAQLHDLTCAVYRLLSEELLDLQFAKTNAQHYKIDNFNTWETMKSSKEAKELAGEVDDRLADVGLWMRMLFTIKVRFKDQLIENFKFIRKLYGLSSTMELQKEQHVDAEPLPASHSSEPSSGEIEGETTSAQPINDSSMTGIDAYSTEFEEIEHIARTNKWEYAMLKYLDVVTLHQAALQSLWNRGERSTAKAFLDKAQFVHVQLRQPSKDKSMSSIDTVLQRHIQVEQADMVKQFLINECNLNKGTLLAEERFPGTTHCETILMSLYLIAAERKNLLDNSESTKKIERLRLPSQFITDQFAGKMTVLPVSKRCCPACNALFTFCIKGMGKDVSYPGSHATWSAVALPPWIPRKAGLAVLEAVKSEVLLRTTRICERMEAKISSPSSTGMSPAYDQEVDGGPDRKEDEVPDHWKSVLKRPRQVSRSHDESNKR
ncbi:hypothetical protein PMIN05_005089 [Paraphaeosphaeria minitans]